MEYDRKHELFGIFVSVPYGGDKNLWGSACRFLFTELCNGTASADSWKIWNAYLSGNGSGPEICLFGVWNIQSTDLWIDDAFWNHIQCMEFQWRVYYYQQFRHLNENG